MAAADKSGDPSFIFNVLHGEGGVESACVCANVVMKFRFKCIASYRAKSSALFALKQKLIIILL